MTAKVTQVLIQLEYPLVLSAVLDYLIRNNKEPVTAHTIEIATELRQPQVSIALGQLTERRWIKKSEKVAEKGKSGRPELMYILLTEKAYTDIEKEQQKNIAGIQDALAKLKSAMTLPKPGASEQAATTVDSPIKNLD